MLNVWARASALAHPFLGRESPELERRNIPDVYLPVAETGVWASDGSVVGILSLLGNEIGALFVDPGFHRTGIGRALMDRARSLGGEFEVEVLEQNLPGRTSYAKLGFELMHRSVHDPTGLEILRPRPAADGSPQPAGSSTCGGR